MQPNIRKSRQNAMEIFQAGLAAVAPGAAIKKYVQRQDDILLVDGREYDLSQYRQLFVIGAGKAGSSMAAAIEEILGDRITQGVITVKYGHLEELSTVKIHEAGHPVPDENGFKATKVIYDLAATADEDTLVICLISGGGSALMPLPVADVTLEDKQATTKVLLSCGATIHEINAIRKHLSAIKGGGLARVVYPATIITLILSDVVGDDLDSIASGPCVPDSMTFADCQSIFADYSIESELPERVRNYIGRGAAGEVPETPKLGDEIFRKTQNVIVGNNFNALIKAKEKSEELGYNTLLLSSRIEGETREVAFNHMAIAAEIELNEFPTPKPACILTGGETTVKLKGNGKGGRNQEFVLAAALKMEGLRHAVVLSAGTDGTDGPTDAAGALADVTTMDRARSNGLDPVEYLDNNDSYTFFDGLDDLYKTGPTNTNVMDIRIILVE
jgi:glycerate 2-kinase